MFLFVFTTVYLYMPYDFELVCFVSGCYDRIYIESLPFVNKKTMIISSVGLCQEICHRKNSNKFAVKVYL